MRLPALLVTACAVVPSTGYYAVPRMLTDRVQFHRQTRSNHPHSRRHAVGDPDHTDTDDDAPPPPPPLQGRDSDPVQRFIYPQLAAATLATAALLAASPFSSSFADGPTVTAVLTPDSSPTSTSRPSTGTNLRGGTPPDVGAILRDRIAFVTSEVTGEKLGQVRRARPVDWRVGNQTVSSPYHSHPPRRYLIRSAWERAS